MFVAYGGYHAKNYGPGPVPPPLLVPALALGLAPVDECFDLFKIHRFKQRKKNTSSDGI